MSIRIPYDEGFLAPDKVERAIRKSGLTQPRTALICLENTHNRAGGRVVHPENFKAIRKLADKHDIPIHLDGELLFEAMENILKIEGYELLSQKVYRVLKTEIIKGLLKPGTKLSEGKIAQQMGMSRAPVKEALKELVAEGFIKVTPNQTMIVAKFLPKI